MKQFWIIGLLFLGVVVPAIAQSAKYEVRFYETVPNGTAFLVDTLTKKKFFFNPDSAICTNEDIENAYVDDSNDLGTTINIQFKEVGARKFEEATRRNINKPLVVVVNDQLITAPVVLDVISGGKVSISGAFSHDEMQNLVAYLTGGKPKQLDPKLNLLSKRQFPATATLLFDQLLIAKDTANLEAILADEVRMKHSNGAEQNKATILEDIISGKFVYTEITEMQLKVDETSDSSVHVVRKVWVKGSLCGNAYDIELDVEEQWMRRMGMWLLKDRKAVKSAKK